MQLAKYSVIFIFVVIIAALYFWLTPFKTKKIAPVNLMLPIPLKQNAAHFIQKQADLTKALLSTAQQEKYKKDFLVRFYSPWDHKDSKTTISASANHQHISNILETEHHLVKHYQNKVTYDNHYQPHPPKWLNNIVYNMDLDQFPNVKKHDRGILVNNAALRELPTNQPSYDSVLEPGEGYPFDYLQESALYLGTPVHILHQTKDKQWLLVKAAGLLGWVAIDNVGYVDQTFIENWKTKPLATLVTYKTIADATQRQHIAIYPGTILPMTADPNTHNMVSVLYPIKTSEHQTNVVSKTASPDWQPWPVSPNVSHFVSLINTLLGIPYGWGDLHFQPDCSGLLRSLYNTVGIWLPRNSGAQAHYAGKFYPLPLAHYSANTREAIVQGKDKQLGQLTPFLTLISFGSKESSVSHIAVYIGNDDDDNPIIFHSTWGLRLFDKHQNQIGRMIVGKSILSHLNLGNNVVIPQHPQWRIDSLVEKPGFNITKLDK